MLPPDAPDLTALDLLESVAELGSLGQAANRHHLSQPAVSMRMRALEQRLGLVLLERDPSGTRLTPAGVEVAVAAQRVLDETAALMALVRSLRADRQSRLRVAASLTVAEHLLPGWLGAVHGASPEASLSLEVANSTRVLDHVEQGRVDLGFVEGHEPDLAGLAGVVVSQDRLVVVVHPEHPWARRSDPVGGDELAASELVVREEGSGTREILEGALARFGGVRSRLVLGSSAALLAAARRNEGPAVLSLLAAQADVEAGRLVVVETGALDLSRSLRAVWLARRGLGPLATALLRAASDEGGAPAGRGATGAGPGAKGVLVDPKASTP